MKKKSIVIFSIVVVLGFSVFYIYEKLTQKVLTVDTPHIPISNSATFNCSEGKGIKSDFYNSIRTVDLNLSDGRKMSLGQTISASGARYANHDESFIFWNKGDTAFVDEAGIITFKDCVEDITNDKADINNDKVSLEKETIISLDETVIAMIKDIYQKDAKYFIVLDYMTVKENKFMNNLDLENLNKKLRTFELDSNTQIQLIRYKENISENPIVQPAELYRILKNNGEDYYGMGFDQDNRYPDSPYYQTYGSPFSVKIERGELVELKQIYQE